MGLRGLKWLAIVLPAGFLVLLEFVRHAYLESIVTPRTARVIAIGIMVVGVFVFSHTVFALVTRLHREIMQRNRHLAATNQILGAFAQSQDLPEVLTLALHRLLDVVQVELGVICFLDERNSELHALAGLGVPEAFTQHLKRRKFGHGLEAQVVRGGVPEVIEDVAADGRVTDELRMLNARSMILLPLKSKGSVVGLALIGSRQRRTFSPLDVQLLQTTGGQIAIALENTWLFNETRSQSARLRILNELGIDLAGELSLDALLQKVVNFSRDLAGARYSALHVLEGNGRSGRFLTSGLSAAEVARIGAPPAGRGLLGVIRAGEALRLPDIAAHPASVGFPAHHPSMKSLLGVPIVSRGTIIGSLYLADKEGGEEFSQADQDMVAMLAAQAAVAIENAWLYEQLQDLTRLQERERIAMDLHDGIIQSIYAVGLHLEGCVDATEAGPAEMRQRLAKAIDGLNRVIREIRNYLLDLRPNRFGTKTLRQVMEDAARELRVTALIDAELVADELAEEPRPDQVVQLSYIVREAVANIIKHAHATSAWIRLASQAEQLVLSVTDNGVGFSPDGRAAGAGNGLQNMERRAMEMGGRLSVKGAWPKGTEVTITLPVARSEEERRHGQGEGLDRRRPRGGAGRSAIPPLAAE